MYLTHRPTTIQDIDACLSLLTNRFALPPDSDGALLRLWRHLITERKCESAILEDIERPAGKRLIAFGLSIFVTDEFAEESASRLPPYIVGHVLERWRQGRPPFLSADEISRTNALAGVNVLTLHRGCPIAVEAPSLAPEIGYKFVEAFMAHHNGYRFKHFQQEIYGEERQALEALGCRVETDYSEFFERGFPPAPPGRRPFLMGLTKDMVPTRFNYFDSLFTVPEPRFLFKSKEQDVLTLALASHTDEEIAERLCLSLWTIKKRWQSLYERAAAVDPEMMRVREGDESGGQGQKRRRLLQYLSRHPEELRPYASSTAKVIPTA